MRSGNRTREKSHLRSLKPLRVDDTGRPSTALRGAVLAFTSSQAPPKLSDDDFSSTNGALAAASTVGSGYGRPCRQLFLEEVPKADDPKTPEEKAVQQRIRPQVVSTYHTPRRTAASSSRRLSSSHVAAVVAAKSSSPAQKSLRPPQSVARRPSAIRRTHSGFAIPTTYKEEAASIAATKDLIQLYEGNDFPRRGPPSLNYQGSRVVTPILSPIPIKPPQGPFTLQSITPPDSPKVPTRQPGSAPRPDTTFSSIGARIAADHVVESARSIDGNSRPSISSNGPVSKPSAPRRVSERSILPLSFSNGNHTSNDASATSSSASSYASALDEFPLHSPKLPTRRLPRTVSEPLSTPKALALPKYSFGPQRPSQPQGQKTSSAREPTLSSTSLTPRLTADSLANAMVASSLASSRAPSPTKILLPHPHRQGRPHHLFHRAHSSDNASRTPSPAKQMRQTLRSSKKDDEETMKQKRNHFIKKHPNKHHEGDRKRWRDTVSEAERKRYEGLWAANKDILLPLTDPPSGTVCNLVVREIWHRSRLPDDVLEEVWGLVDMKGDGSLEKEEFVVGMWLIDQRLKGRKLPVKVGESIWGSVRMLSGIKVRKHRR